MDGCDKLERAVYSGPAEGGSEKQVLPDFRNIREAASPNVYVHSF